MSATVRIEAGANLTPGEVNAAYGWVEWPEREPWRLAAVGRSCTWFAARDGDELVGIARLLDDGPRSRARRSTAARIGGWWCWSAPRQPCHSSPPWDS
jgi:hypothetical protein